MSEASDKRPLPAGVRQGTEWRAYAAAALATSGATEAATMELSGPWQSTQQRAEWCVEMADAMVRAREAADHRDIFEAADFRPAEGA